MIEFKTKPFGHQLEEFEKSKDYKSWGFWWETGCGKTKPVLDTIAHLYAKGEITGALVLAPNGVHQNWMTDEIPKHLPDVVADATVALGWSSSKSNTKKWKRKEQELLENPGLSILCMSYHGIMVARGAKLAKRLLAERSCIYITDEAHSFKSPGSKRCKRVLASALHALYRRAMTGTPSADSPFDVYATIKFLDPAAWAALGISTFAGFKAYFGVWERKTITVPGGGKREFDKLVTYKNLDKLHEVVSRYGSRLQKSAVMDLPPKLYSRRYFEISDSQRRLYKELKEDYMAWLDGQPITAPLPVTRLLRFQQVTAGYVPTDDDEEPQLIDKKPRRIESLRGLLSEISSSTIIWAKFQKDIDLICALLREEGESFVVFDGRTSDDDRLNARRAFQEGKVKFFVANPAAAGRGLTLHRAKTVVFYSVSFKLEERIQAEDRAHRAGMDNHAVHYIDIVARGTVDTKILARLRTKKQAADQVTGDEFRDWI